MKNKLLRSFLIFFMAYFAFGFYYAVAMAGFNQGHIHDWFRITSCIIASLFIVFIVAFIAPSVIKSLK